MNENKNETKISKIIESIFLRPIMTKYKMYKYSYII